MSVSIDCPNCDQEITDELSEVENDDCITCPHCLAELVASITYDGEGDETLSLSISDVEVEADAEEEILEEEEEED